MPAPFARVLPRDIDRQRVDLPDQIGAKGCVDRAVAGNARHIAENRGANHDAEVAFAAFLITCMTAMGFAFINDIKDLRGKCGLKCGDYLIGSCHFLPFCSSITPKKQ